jgi:hypothetical protein
MGDDVGEEKKKPEKCKHCGFWHVIERIKIASVAGEMEIASCPNIAYGQDYVFLYDGAK